MSNFYASYPVVGGNGVTSLDGLTGALTLVAGFGISIVDGSSTITISASGAGDVTLTPVGSSPNANGASLSGQALTLQPANTSFPGVLLAADWNTFNSKQNALTISNLTDVGTDGIVITGGTGAVIGSGTNIAQHVADTTHNGYLSSTDWNTFNGKQASGNYITALTGDVTATGPGSAAATVAKIQGTVVSGTTGSGNVAFSASPTFTGTLNAAAVSLSSTLNMNSHLINSVTDPVGAQDAATKNYVDSMIAALQPATACYAASTATIAGTYINGVAGVGATFTTTATGVFTIDGVTPPLAARILLKDQSSGFQNGIYNITTLGSIGVSTVFTRSSDYNTASDMNSAGLIPIINGTVNALSSWQQTATITTVGTDALVFQEFTANPSLYLLKANNLNDVANATTSFNNISGMTTLGDLIYGGASGTRTRLAGNATTAPQFLKSLGSGGLATAPVWAQPAFSDISGALSLTTQVSGILPIANGGTNSSSVTIVPAASAWAGWDANKNFSANNLIDGYRTTATAAGTTTLAVGDAFQQFFTGSTTQIVAMPVTSTLVLGQAYYITNNSTGIVTVNSSGANLILAMGPSTSAIFTCILTSGTSAASWSATYIGNGGAITPTIQKFTSGTAQTYTTPAGCIYIRVRMVGAGGGGSGSGTGSNGSGGNGGSSTFGTSLLTAGGGSGSTASSSLGGQAGAAGTASIGAGATGTALSGGVGNSGGVAAASGTAVPGGVGGDSFFGGAGGGGQPTTPGGAAAANSGSGGGGGGGVGPGASGGGGGAGGYVEALIPAPAASYAYSVGAGGSLGTAGTGGQAGTAGAFGYIEITEYYSNGAVGTATNVTGIVAVVNGGTGTNGVISAAKTTTYAILNSDSVILVDGTGGNFSVTLPTAVGIAGQEFTIKRIDQLPTSIVTIATTSSQTIDGAATKKLATQYELFTVVSDGANWQILAHAYPSALQPYTPTLTGFGTVTGLAARSRRVGDSLEIIGVFVTGTTAASSATITLGYGGVNSNVTTDSTVSSQSLIGQAGYATNNTVLFDGGILATPSSGILSFSRASSTTSILSAANGSSVAGNGVAVSFNAKVKITNWEG